MSQHGTSKNQRYNISWSINEIRRFSMRIKNEEKK